MGLIGFFPMKSPLDAWNGLDQEVRRQYTKLSKKWNLDQGTKKYKVGLGLWLAHNFLSGQIGYYVVEGFDLIRCYASIFDGVYNMRGAIGTIREDTDSDSKALDPFVELYKINNSRWRLPTFLAGTGLVGKFGVDVFYWAANGKAIEPLDQFSFQYGLGLLSLASSMYIKDTDTKLLQKDSVFKKGYYWALDKISPHPAPQPSPLSSYSTIDDVAA